MNSGVPILIDEIKFRMGLEEWISIDYEKTAHQCFAGRTGSGKTIAAKLLLARTILLAPEELQPVEITVIDPKNGEDFSFLEGLPRVYRGENSPKGLEDFYEIFKKRQSGKDTTRNLKICFIDEFGSLINLIEDKKAKESAQRKLSLLLMLSRSYKISVQLATQQPSAQIFGTGASGSREQFGGILLLGDSGNETVNMLFDSDSREKIKEFGSIGGRGIGWLSLNGSLASPVRVPIVDVAKVDSVISESMEKQKG